MSDFLLQLGDLDFSPDVQGSDDWTYKVRAFRRGRPVPIVAVMNSLLRDGAIERKTGYENRDQSVTVTVKGKNSDALDRAEAALFAEVERERNELRWRPPNGIGEPSVFDVLWADLQPSDDDGWDQLELLDRRVYTLAFRCEPFVRSTRLQSFSVTATLDPHRTVLLDGTTTDGWSPSQAQLASVTVAGRQAIRVRSSTGWTLGSPNIANSGVSVTVPTATPFVSLDYLRRSWMDRQLVRFVGANGAVYVEKVMEQTLADGFVRSFFSTADLQAPFAVQVSYEHRDTGIPTPIEWYVDEVAALQAIPSLSPKQSLRLLPIKGSARTRGSLAISHPTTALGDVIAVTGRDLAEGYLPDLRRFRTDGGSVTDDSSAISGKRETFGPTTKFVATVPFAMYDPDVYAILVRARDGAGTYTVSTREGTTTFNSTSTVVDTAPAGVWQMIDVGLIDLPSRRAAPTAKGSFDIVLEAPGGTVLDDVYVLPVKDAGLTVATGLTKRRLELVAPSVEFPRGAYWTGDQADLSDGFDARAALEGNSPHVFYPGGTYLWVAASGPASPVTTDGTYHARGHTNSADD